MKKIIFYLYIPVILFCGCSGNHENQQEEFNARTPVKIVNVERTTISDIVHLNATSSYQRNNILRSDINGYIEKLFVSVGDHVKAGSPLFTIKTKEARALSNFNSRDSLFAIKGQQTILSPSSGIVTGIMRLTNDYVSDGDQLASIVDESSLVFLLNVPFEENEYISIGKKCEIVLPGSSIIDGIILSKYSAMDPLSQTQVYVVKPNTQKMLPENLVADVRLVRQTKESAQVVDKTCVLSDETMEHFWVMKMISDSVAVKVYVLKGIVGDIKVEIASPEFKPGERIISVGNYGLPDTALVLITKD